MRFDNKCIWVCIPAMDESDWLPACLRSLSQQSIGGFKVVVCVNQPEAWWSMPEKSAVCERNMEMIETLLTQQNHYPFKLFVVDRASRGKGWPEGKGGVGMARRVATNVAFQSSENPILVVSADADTQFDSTYLEDVLSMFNLHQSSHVLAAPYMHPLTEDASIDVVMLRYELYLRFYLLNLLQIGSPFAFTPLGSAIAITGSALKKAGGFPDRAMGEDFYLLQKMAKMENLRLSLPSRVYPAARLSLRVAYGTGPALINGMDHQWSAYPIIHPGHFLKVKSLYDLFPTLYVANVETPADWFLSTQFGDTPVWDQLRSNSRSVKTFTRACHQKFDGLRIWQWMRREALADDPLVSLKKNVSHFLPEKYLGMITNDIFTDVNALSMIRMALIAVEEEARRLHDHEL